jgi:hypothetical protein
MPPPSGWVKWSVIFAGGLTAIFLMRANCQILT